MSPVAEPAPAPDCPFCHRDTLAGLLAETDHFYVLADHAPLIEGHTLLIPKAHHACYGAIPAALDPELLALKRRAARILTAAYAAPVFFEHGVFRQTVYHAHLHAMPFGPVDFGVHALAAEAGGRHVHSRDDVRAWYATHGHYFYIEQPACDGSPAQAAVFPPDLQLYFRVLGALRDASGHHGGWLPPAERHAARHPKVAALTDHWRRLDV